MSRIAVATTSPARVPAKESISTSFGCITGSRGGMGGEGMGEEGMGGEEEKGGVQLGRLNVLVSFVSIEAMQSLSTSEHSNSIRLVAEFGWSWLWEGAFGRQSQEQMVRCCSASFNWTLALFWRVHYEAWKERKGWKRCSGE